LLFWQILWRGELVWGGGEKSEERGSVVGRPVKWNLRFLENKKGKGMTGMLGYSRNVAGNSIKFWGAGRSGTW